MLFFEVSCFFELMTNLSTVINGIISRAGCNYSDLVKSSGVLKSALSAIIQGGRCSSTNLEKLVSSSLIEQEEKSEIIKAHLLDELNQASVAPDLIHILTPSETQTDDLRGQLTAEVYGWLTVLGRSIMGGNKEVADLVADLAALVRSFEEREKKQSPTRRTADRVESPGVIAPDGPNIHGSPEEPGEQKGKAR